jgi:hypothetical protein
MKRGVCLCAALFTAVCCSAAESPACPEKIEVEQKLPKELPGWAAMLDDAPQQLAGVTFYEGPPEEKASLVYDSITKAAGKETAAWEFNAQGSAQFWMTCSYAGTTLMLKKRLPPAIRTCTVTWDASQHVAGLPLIIKMACH